MVHMTVISGRERRRRWGDAEREQIVAASFSPDAVVAEVARQFDVSTSLIYKWRREARQSEVMFVPAVLPGDEGSSMPDVASPARSETPAIQLALHSGTTMNIAANAPERLVLAVLRALR
jgi:transposase